MVSQNLVPRELAGGFERLAIACPHGDADKSTSPARPQRTPNPYRAALESIALRHQIAVLERSGSRRPAFAFGIGCLDFLSRWWSQWRDSLIIVQPETVQRWRREGWSALWRYRRG